MTDASSDDTPRPPNLAILKGITWGLGFLLILGVALVAVKISSGMSSLDESIAVAPAAAESLAALPSVPLRAGEKMMQISGVGQSLFLLTDQGRLLAIVPGDGAAAEWVNITTAVDKE